MTFLRERLGKADVIEELFEQFEGYRLEKGLEARGGQINDETQGPVPKQRNSREENMDLKAGVSAR